MINIAAFSAYYLNNTVKLRVTGTNIKGCYRFIFIFKLKAVKHKIRLFNLILRLAPMGFC